MSTQTRYVLVNIDLFLAGLLAGTAVTGLLFILGVTLISTVSHSIMNPTEWTLAVPLIGLVAAVVTTGGSVGIIRSRHPSATLAYGMIAAAVIFFLVILGYYFGYAR